MLFLDEIISYEDGHNAFDDLADALSGTHSHTINDNAALKLIEKLEFRFRVETQTASQVKNKLFLSNNNFFINISTTVRCDVNKN